MYLFVVFYFLFLFLAKGVSKAVPLFVLQMFYYCFFADFGIFFVRVFKIRAIDLIYANRNA